MTKRSDPEQAQLIAAILEEQRTLILKKEAAKAKRAASRVKIYAGPIDDTSRQIARDCCDKRLDTLEVRHNDQRAECMKALSTVRALLWQHDRWSYQLEDAQHVMALIKSGARISSIALAFVGAFRTSYWRERVPRFRDVRHNMEEWVARAKRSHGQPLESANKAESIARWREAFAHLPPGERIGRHEPDFQVVDRSVIEAEALAMETFAGHSSLPSIPKPRLLS